MSRAPVHEMNFWWKWKFRLAAVLRLDLTHTQTRYARFVESLVTDQIRWLEVGCGRQIFPEYALPDDQQRTIFKRASLLVGVDVDPSIRENPFVTSRVFGLGGSLPFKPGSFDLVTANMVVEHLPEPEDFLRDVASVLKPGGLFVFHTPNWRNPIVMIAGLVPDGLKGRIVWLLERRKEEDRFRTFYRMNTSTEVRRLAVKCGYEITALRIVGSNGFFSMLGPIGWIECFMLKALESGWGGRFNSNLICALRKK